MSKSSTSLYICLLLFPLMDSFVVEQQRGGGGGGGGGAGCQFLCLKKEHQPGVWVPLKHFF